MDYAYIEQLLERYFQADTTEQEERILQAFFRQDTLPAHLQQYAPSSARSTASAGSNWAMTSTSASSSVPDCPSTTGPRPA